MTSEIDRNIEMQSVSTENEVTPEEMLPENGNKLPDQQDPIVGELPLQVGDVIEKDPATVIMDGVYEPTDNFYIQKIYLTYIRQSRFDFFTEICRGKKVLHIGCADAMVFSAGANSDSNLHMRLSKLTIQPTVNDVVEGVNADTIMSASNKDDVEMAIAETILTPTPVVIIPPVIEPQTIVDGLDIDVETIQALAAVCPGTYFTSYDQVQSEYDIIIVPEVMEHVPDVHDFLKKIFAISSYEYFFTVPSMSAAEIFCAESYALESVHPDHKYWFSPYTLYSVIKPFSDGYNIQMYYMESKTQVGIRLLRKPPPPPPIITTSEEEAPVNNEILPSETTPNE